MAKPAITGIEEATEHLREYHLGQVIAADCEARIIAAYAPERAEWERIDRAHEQKPTVLVRKMRNLLDAEANERNFRRTAQALDILLAEITRLSIGGGQ